MWCPIHRHHNDWVLLWNKNLSKTANDNPPKCRMVLQSLMHRCMQLQFEKKNCKRQQKHSKMEHMWCPIHRCHDNWVFLWNKNLSKTANDNPPKHRMLLQSLMCRRMMPNSSPLQQLCVVVKQELIQNCKRQPTEMWNAFSKSHVSLHAITIWKKEL